MLHMDSLRELVEIHRVFPTLHIFSQNSQLSAVPARPFLCSARWHTESCPIGQHSNIHLLALKNAACHNSSNIQTSVKYFDTNLFLLIKCTVLHIVTKFNIQMKYTRTLL